jgi:hypothetical protein
MEVSGQLRAPTSFSQEESRVAASLLAPERDWMLWAEGNRTPAAHLLRSPKLKLCYDRRSVGQSVFVSGSHLEPMTIFYFSVLLSETFEFLHVGHLL